MQDFSVEGSSKGFWGGPIFEGRNENLRFGKALQFGVIFQKYALKLIKIWKIIENLRENANFSESFFDYPEGPWEKWVI